MGKRRKARELALQALYQADFHDYDADDCLREFWKGMRVSPEITSFAKFLMDGVLARRAEIDRLIESHSENWRVDRMSRVDRNIIRMAAFELLACTDIPSKVIIDEAIEIGKRYGSGESGSFINGILDPISKNIER